MITDLTERPKIWLLSLAMMAFSVVPTASGKIIVLLYPPRMKDALPFVTLGVVMWFDESVVAIIHPLVDGYGNKMEPFETETLPPPPAGALLQSGIPLAVIVQIVPTVMFVNCGIITAVPTIAASRRPSVKNWKIWCS